jgi:hypothetical protein
MIIALVVSWCLPPIVAGAAVQATLYVHPLGRGSVCTQSLPCALATAKAAVEQRTSTMSGDLVVELRGGTYRLPSTLEFGPADSGQNGHEVIYRAAPGEEVVLSGGIPISGWSVHDEAKNIWKAAVPPGLKTRQLYVNGRRASVASMPANMVFGAMRETATGFTYPSPWPNTWQNTGSVDVVYGSSESWRPWTYSICPVSSISNGSVVLSSSCYANVRNTNGVRTPTAVENNYALLASPGQFYVDSGIDTIYYIPQAGQDMRTATVVAGRLQTLVSLAGSPDSPVHHMQFAGLSFEHATWLFDEQGVADLQANVLIGTTQNPSSQLAPLPANVTCHSCDHVTFRDNRFQRLGGSGLGFDGGGQDNLVIGNVITDVAGNGIQIGVGSIAPPAILESGYTVSNNYVHDVATEYLDGVGILATWVQHTWITHNEVWDTPYTGISLGWGWGADPSQPMADNHIDFNHVHNVMTSTLYDGGAIYVVGPQAAAAPSTMTGNLIEHVSQRYAALYLDQASSHWQVERNVVSGYAPAWLFVQSFMPEKLNAHNNTARNNYVGHNAGTVFGSPPSDNVVAGNTVGVTGWSVEAQSIMADAGLEPGHARIRGGGPQTNLAYTRPVYSSSAYSQYHPAYQANNERITTPGNGPNSTPFASAANDPTPWWQVDLGASHVLSKIQVLFRQDGVDNLAERQNIQIWVSNHADMSQGHTTACTIGTAPLPYQSSYSCPAPAGAWRHVAVLKTGHLALGQVRVFGEISSTPEQPSS